MNIRKSRKEKKRAAGKLIPATLLFFLFFLYLASLIREGGREETAVAYHSDTWVEMDRLWGKERIPLEEYLAGMMAATIPMDYEKEVLKAQALILRSWCYHLAKKENGYDIIPSKELENIYFSDEDCRRVWGEEYEANRSLIMQVLKETEGMVLVWQGQIIAPPFFRLSNGKTRAVEEYQSNTDRFGYVRSITCSEDLEAEEYLGRIEISGRELEKKLQQLLETPEWTLDKIILYRDTADYVKTVEIGDKKIQGEKFRYAFELPSSCFTLTKQDDTIVIKTKGIGHGFGFSQFAANALAKQGYDYRRLLGEFFMDISVEKR